MGLPFIIVTLGSKEVERRKLDQEIITIGRAPENDIVISNLAVSRNHSMIHKMGDKVFIKDLDSANGTFVNGVRIDETEFSNGDVILIGKHVIKFYYEEDSKSEGSFDFQNDGGTVVVDARTQEKFLRKLKGEYKASKLILPNGREVEINGDSFTIGNGDNLNLRIEGIFIKNPHAKIIRGADGAYRIVSTGSIFRSTTVNGIKVKEMVLKDGDMIKIGKHEMIFTL
ncbi:MAG TPA: FHA domain-containing protein [Thermodesulfobacteriota bacterium]|nr:FHA domain-containing protein [Thermodesulfobacteriota bacterium]